MARKLTAEEITRQLDGTDGDGTSSDPAPGSADDITRRLDAAETSRQPVSATPAKVDPLADALTSAGPVDVPGGGAMPEVQPAPGAVATTHALWPTQVDTSITPGPNVGSLLPLSRNQQTGALQWALPNPVRSLLTEGPQLDDQGKLVVPAVTLGPNGLNVTPSAAAAAGFAVRPLSFSGTGAQGVVAPGTFGQQSPLTEGSPLPRILDLIRKDQAAPETAPPPEGGAPGAGAPPNSAGAMGTPTAVAHLTPAETAAYRATAEGQKLLERQEPGVPDRNQYVIGSHPNAAEQEQTVNTARELKSLGITSPEVSQGAKDAAFLNNEARDAHVNQTIKGPVQIEAENTARKTDLERDTAQVFNASNGAVDPAPMVKFIQDTMQRPTNRQNTALQSDFAPLIKRFLNDDGTPKVTSPEEMWGLRQDLGRLVDKRMQANNPNAHYIAGNVAELQHVIDTAIEPAAPGFRQMLDTYKAHSDKIDAMTALNDRKAGLYDSQNRITYNKVQTLMRDITDARMSGDVTSPFAKIDNDTMTKLWALRDDLRRSASALELARTPGSDTVQNLRDMIVGLAKGPEAQAALHGVAAHMFGPAGNVAVSVGRRIIEPIIAGRTAARQAVRGQELIRPSNPLTRPPGAAGNSLYP
jgi:hypothetical protein